ncbi:hypothetical protein EPN83_02100 [Patescibacteria group bacterium]|nr:MAG: hypothetical protein EPN83_02100 [Patescibacteria group bacterium]
MPRSDNDMKISMVGKILIADFAIALGVVVWLYLSNVTSSILIDLYGVLFLGFIPVVGGVNGLIIAKRWGSFKSAVGRAVIFLSLGLISWGLGTYVFSGIYNFLLHVEVPYPSIADVGYILSLPLWAVGMIQLSRATGAKYGLRSKKGKAILFAIPILVILVSYYLLVIVARGGSIDLSGGGIPKIFFDLAYPIGDVIILTLATLVYGLSYNYFGGIYKKSIYVILLGFVIMYAADFLFSYTTTIEIWQPADWVDLLFTTAVFILSMGVTMLDSRKALGA